MTTCQLDLQSVLLLRCSGGLKLSYCCCPWPMKTSKAMAHHVGLGGFLAEPSWWHQQTCWNEAGMMMMQFATGYWQTQLPRYGHCGIWLVHLVLNVWIDRRLIYQNHQMVSTCFRYPGHVGWYFDLDIEMSGIKNMCFFRPPIYIHTRSQCP